jgi:hypothetical protein
MTNSIGRYVHLNRVTYSSSTPTSTVPKAYLKLHEHIYQSPPQNQNWLSKLFGYIYRFFVSPNPDHYKVMSVASTILSDQQPSQLTNDQIKNKLQNKQIVCKTNRLDQSVDISKELSDYISDIENSSIENDSVYDKLITYLKRNAGDNLFECCLEHDNTWSVKEHKDGNENLRVYTNDRPFILKRLYRQVFLGYKYEFKTISEKQVCFEHVSSTSIQKNQLDSIMSQVGYRIAQINLADKVNDVLTTERFEDINRGYADKSTGGLSCQKEFSYFDYDPQTDKFVLDHNGERVEVKSSDTFTENDSYDKFLETLASVLVNDQVAETHKKNILNLTPAREFENFQNLQIETSRGLVTFEDILNKTSGGRPDFKQNLGILMKRLKLQGFNTQDLAFKNIWKPFHQNIFVSLTEELSFAAQSQGLSVLPKPRRFLLRQSKGQWVMNIDLDIGWMDNLNTDLRQITKLNLVYNMTLDSLSVVQEN